MVCPKCNYNFSSLTIDSKYIKHTNTGYYYIYPKCLTELEVDDKSANKGLASIAFAIFTGSIYIFTTKWSLDFFGGYLISVFIGVSLFTSLFTVTKIIDSGKKVIVRGTRNNLVYEQAGTKSKWQDQKIVILLLIGLIGFFSFVFRDFPFIRQYIYPVYKFLSFFAS